MNRLALMDLINREAHKQGSSVEVRVEEYLFKLAQKMGISMDRIEDAIYSNDNYAIFIP